MLTSPSHFGPPHQRKSTLSTTLASQRRKCAMATTVAPVYIREEPLPIRGDCATYRACAARARWGQSDRSVARPREYFLGGGPAIGTSPGGHSTGRYRPTGQQSPYSNFLPTVCPMIPKTLVLAQPSHSDCSLCRTPSRSALSMRPYAALSMGQHPTIMLATISLSFSLSMVRTPQPQKPPQKPSRGSPKQKDAIGVRLPLPAAPTPTHDFLERKYSIANGFMLVAVRCRALP